MARGKSKSSQRVSCPAQGSKYLANRTDHAVSFVGIICGRDRHISLSLLKKIIHQDSSFSSKAHRGLEFVSKG